MSHWDDHPDYPVADWKYEVANDDTRQSYAEWCDTQESRAEEEQLLEDGENCRTCGEPHAQGGDGWDGECGDCADRTASQDEGAGGSETLTGRHHPPEDPNYAQFEVVVGNIGTVYRGPLLKQALEDYAEYKWQSVEGYGRAAGESVVILRDGEPTKYEHRGINADE